MSRADRASHFLKSTGWSVAQGADGQYQVAALVFGQAMFLHMCPGSLFLFAVKHGMPLPPDITPEDTP